MYKIDKSPKEERRMNFWKRTLALLLVLCMMIPCALAEEDVEIDLGELVDDVLLTDDGEEIDDPEGIGAGLMITDDEVEDALSALDQDMELDESIDPEDLELNPNLPDNVVNILLVGIDTRSTSLEEGYQHGDVQIICSINKDTGAIKLTSLLRDMYVTIPGYKNKNRINVAYHRGGGELAMRTINRNFELNIEHYVTINFYGLASIIDSIGGIDMELTKAEANAINTYLRKHPPTKYDNTDGKDRVKLESKAGVQHLDGIQAVMYARVRSIDNDFSRTARQRKLLEVLLNTVMQDMDVMKLYSLMESVIPYVATNMNATAIFNLATSVLQSGIIQKAQSGETLMEQFRLPMDKAYSYKTIDGASVVYMSTSKFKQNKEALHEFIYGNYYPAD